MYLDVMDGSTPNKIQEQCFIGIDEKGAVDCVRLDYHICGRETVSLRKDAVPISTSFEQFSGEMIDSYLYASVPFDDWMSSL